MRIGVMLPTFTGDPSPVAEAARVAEGGGLDGTFVFDHLWPIGNPGRPALWSFGVLGAVAATTSRVVIGPLVARIDLLPEDDLVRGFLTLEAITGGGRVIAALGTGDRLSAPENIAYGVGQAPVLERLAAVARVADRLRGRGIETWIGGTSRVTAGLAREHADGHNLWAVTAEDLARRAAEDGHVPKKSWGGQVLIGRDRSELVALRARYGDRGGLISGTVEGVADRLRALAAAGATWAVCAPLDYIAQPARAVETLCLVAEAVK